ncbi:cytochrome P450 [Dactylosporangium sp. CA-139066]|uniref:cytochrome P450 n=1 Tax=Dactylosporangium sp. CA-139066 TaxID=3239930 RepID=UPI003D8E0D2B
MPARPRRRRTTEEGTVMAQASIYEQILDPANRANPYPLYTQLRRTPVTREADGTYVVSTYAEILMLLHDHRVSSDPRSRAEFAEGLPGLPLSFISRDPPEHDRLRELATRPFGPPCTPERIEGMRPWLTETTDDLIGNLAGRHRIDIVDDFAYPLPVTAICRLLGVPREDQPRFHHWADGLVETADPTTGTFAERQRRRNQITGELGEYLGGLADDHAARPGDDLISGLLTDTGPHAPMARADLLSTCALLLVAGHETTVNLITNGMLTLLRHPDVLDRLREEPDLVTPLVEELLRYEPPVQLLTSRTALADIDIAGTTIPRGSPIALMLAAGSRDPGRFPDPDRFDPDRTDNVHLGYGSGIHYCYGAPLARVETQVALPALARRLVNPRLVADPPPYRPNPTLRGPRHLLVDIDAVTPATGTAARERVLRPAHR